MLKFVKLFTVLLIAGLVFFSCENDDSTAPSGTQMGLNGLVQKGPFITGSTIEVQELNGNFSPNGNSFNVSTEDNFGSFSLESEISTDYVEIISTGFYFNEVSGSITDANLTLRTLTPVSETLTANVNILTTLAKKRIVHLINNEDKSFTEAKSIAEGEILTIFSITDSTGTGFEDMDISQGDDVNGILLAVSAVLQGTNSVSELSALISTIIEDIKTDGVLDDANSNEEILNNAKFLSLVNVRENIENRYDELGLNIEIPNFEQYIENIWSNNPPTCSIVSPSEGDTLFIGEDYEIKIHAFDLDGNSKDIQLYIDNNLKESTTLFDSIYVFNYNWSVTDTTQFHVIKVVATDDDGAEGVDSISVELNGYKWEEISSSLPWGSSTFVWLSFNDKIYSYADNLRFSSSDFYTWEQLGGYSDSHPLKYVLDNKMWILAPYHTPTLNYTEDGENWEVSDIPRVDDEMIKDMFSFNELMYCITNSNTIFKLVDNTWIEYSTTFPDIDFPFL